MSNYWFVPIVKLEYWRANSWVKYDEKGSKQILLRVYYDQLMIVADTKVLESINMSSKIKGVYKGDVLILIVCDGGKEIRKIKFQIMSNVTQSLKRLGQNFPVINHNCTQKKIMRKPKFTKIEEVLKGALENKDISVSFSPSPLQKNFVKMCLLDPKFPQTILETKNILDLINKS